jgi:uncharacterized membrane protein YccC
VRLADLVHPTDPGHFTLRSALRVAVVTPIAFAIGLQIGPQAALFAIFGSLSMGIFVDFDGPRQVRALAYTTLSLAGVVLICLGTLCSHDPLAATVAMGIVGFAILFAGVVNGYLASATPAALLAFVLPVMVAADADQIPQRLEGWLLASVLTIPSILLIFPARPRDRLRSGIADACNAVADLVELRTEETAAAAAKAIEGLHRRFASTPYRPTGPTGSTGALAEMLDDLDWLTATASTLVDADSATRSTASERALHEATVAALRSTGALLRGDLTARPDTEFLSEGRDRILDELLDQLSAEVDAPEDDDALWARMTRAWQVRVTSYVALDIAGKALIASGAPTEEGAWWLRYLRRQSIALAATRRVATVHSGVQSVWFRNSVRGAIGLALAVLIAQETNVQHGFWVVLGVISVLRSSAVGTSRSIVQAFLGTLAGIVIAAGLLLAIGDHEVALWVALPIAAFFAAYAPKALSFAAGQAGFSIAVLVAFNLIDPTGWKVGIIRIEDVSIGFAISLGVGLLFWPRGAAALLRQSIGTAFVTSGRYTAAVCARMFGGLGPVTAEQSREAITAEGRLDIALRQRLSERGAYDNVRLAAAIRLIAAAARIRRTGASIETLYSHTFDISRPEAIRPLIGDAHDLGDWIAAFGQALAEHEPGPAPQPPDPVAHPSLAAGVREAVAAGDRQRAFAAVSCVWTGLHLELLGRMQARISAAAAALD